MTIGKQFYVFGKNSSSVEHHSMVLGTDFKIITSNCKVNPGSYTTFINYNNESLILGNNSVDIY